LRRTIKSHDEGRKVDDRCGWERGRGTPRPYKMRYFIPSRVEYLAACRVWKYC